MVTSAGKSKWADSPLISGLLMAVAASFSAEVSRLSGDASSLWIANGVVLIYVLSIWPLRRRVWHLLAATVANAAVVAVFRPQYSAGHTISAALANTAEISGMLWLAGRFYNRANGKFRITAPRFTGYTMVVVAVVTSLRLMLPDSWVVAKTPEAVVHLYGGHVIGMLLVSALATHWRAGTVHVEFQRDRALGTWFCLFAVVSITAIIFTQNTLPALYVIIPVLIYVLFERGLAIATISIFLVAVLTTLLTMQGYGVIARVPGLDAMGRSVYLQVFIAIVLITIYPVGRVVYKQKRLQTLYTMLANNSRDVITRSTPHGVRIYCSPSVLEVLGYTPEEMLNKSSVQSIHPDDVEGYQAMLKQLRSGAANTAVYSFRALARNGSYVWMEGRYRMMMHPITGKPQEIIASTRDISERVAAEEELRTAYRNLERLASTDSLTSLANRRTFDQTLEREWRRAMRERTPLALLLLDVDYFKNYNDTLGHPAGDEVLRRIGNCLGDIVQRPGDLAARYGGEEFVALLPITDEAGALHIANRIMEAVADLAIPHPASMASDRLTLSIGIASLVPVPGTNPEGLVDAADRALYEVKRKSRNGVAVAGQVAGQTGGLFAVEKPAGAPVRTGTSA